MFGIGDMAALINMADQMRFVGQFVGHFFRVFYFQRVPGRFGGEGVRDITSIALPTHSTHVSANGKSVSISSCATLKT